MLDATAGCVRLDADVDRRRAFDGVRVAISSGGREVAGPRSNDASYYVEFGSAPIATGELVTLAVEGSDWVLSWDPDIDADQVELRLLEITGQVSAADGELTVPASMLGAIAAGPAPVFLSPLRSSAREVDGLELVSRVGKTTAESVAFQ